MPFVIISTVKSFLIYLTVSLVSELHNYSTRSASSNRVAIPSFRTYLRRFCFSNYRKFFWNDIPQVIRDKPSRKMFRKMFRKALVPCPIQMIPYLFCNLLSYFVIFPSLFFFTYYFLLFFFLPIFPLGLVRCITG